MFRNTYVQQLKKKEYMNLKESWGTYKEGFGGRKEKEMIQAQKYR